MADSKGYSLPGCSCLQQPVPAAKLQQRLDTVDRFCRRLVHILMQDCPEQVAVLKTLALMAAELRLLAAATLRQCKTMLECHAGACFVW